MTENLTDDPNYLKEYQQYYYKYNKNKIIERQKDYYTNNRERLKKYQISYQNNIYHSTNNCFKFMKKKEERYKEKLKRRQARFYEELKLKEQRELMRQQEKLGKSLDLL